MSEQAAYFLKNAGIRAGDPLVLDWEDQGVPDTDKDRWIKTVQSAAPHSRVLLYCNRDFWLHRDHTSFAGDGLWIADPDAPAGHPRIDHDWLIHQYSSAGGVDHDLAAFNDAAAMRGWALKGAQPPTGPVHRYEPYPGRAFFALGRRSPIVAAMHGRLVAVGCGRYRTTSNRDLIGPGDVTSYEAWQRTYNADHHKGWTGAALQWPPGKETWDALHVPNV